MIGLLTSLALGATLEGRVTDEFGEPLAGVYVVAYDGAIRQAGLDGPTGPDGRYQVEVPPGRMRLRVVPGNEVNRVEAWIPGDSREICDATVFVASDEEAVDVGSVALFPALSVEGVLLDPSGEPLVGAEIEARPRRGALDVQLRRGISRSDGSFDVVGLPPDTLWVLRVTADELPRQYLGGAYGIGDALEIGGEAGERVQLDDEVLLGGITVRGAVSGPGGPLGGAAVSVFSQSQIRSTRSDDAGRYTVSGLPPGEITAWVDADGHGRAYWPDSVVPGDRLSVEGEGTEVEDFDVRAPLEATVSGRITGVDDLEGINVLWVHESGTVGLGATTDESGSFSLAQVPPGRWNLNVRGEVQGVVTGLVGGEEPQVWEITEGESLSVQAEVRPAVTISGVVTDPAGQPASDALVTLRSRTTDVRRSGYVNPDGSYLFGGLEGGDTWDLWAEGDPLCEGDPDRVRWYYRDTPDPLQRIGVARQGGESVVWSVVLPDDRDSDGIDDAWERDNGLVVGARDADDDPDGDGLSNLIEYWEDRDPQAAEKSGCGSLPASIGGSGLVAWMLLGWLVRRRRS